MVLFCRKYDGYFVTVDENNVSKSVFMKLAIGQVVKFREVTNMLSVSLTHSIFRSSCSFLQYLT